MTGDRLLDVRGLQVRLTGGPRRTIVDNIDFSLVRGESIAIVGESGSGKSLTARALVNLMPTGTAASGSVRLRGEELLSSSRRTMRHVWGSRVSMVMQDPFTTLSPTMKVWSQITEALRAAPGRTPSRTARRDVAASLLAEVGITDADVLDKYPFALSGGMRQRVAIAAAVAAGPELLIADEPTTALDTTTQQDVLALLRRLQRDRNMGLVLITHDLRLAFSTADRVLVLYAGAMLELADSAELWKEPLHPYSLGLLLSEPPADRTVERLTAIPGSVPSADNAPSGCVFAPRCEWVRDICSSSRPPLVELRPGRHTACARIADIDSEMRVARSRGETESTASPILVEQGRTALLSTSGLSKRYGSASRLALDSADIQVAAGESVALVGESGSGKTTLARCLVGLEEPTAGSITIDGMDASSYRRLDTESLRELRSRIQIVFQDPYSSLNPMHSVEFTLRQALSMRPSIAAPATVAELLEMVGLPSTYLRRRPTALSGGERQRVAIARSLAVAPRLLICDEVVSALDVSVQAQILNLLTDLRRNLDLALLFVSHDLAVVRQVTSRAYVLYKGRIIESGPTATVLDNPAEPYTKRLVAASPRVTSEDLR